MRKIAVVAAMLALSACGSSGPDFNVEVSGEAHNIKQQLASLNQMSAGAAGLAAVKVANDGDDLVYTIPAADGHDPGTIRLSFLQEGSKTNLGVTVDVPMVPMGGDLYLSEDKVENELKTTLRNWAGRYGNAGSSADTTELEIMLAAVAVAAQRADADKLVLASNFDSSDWGSTSDSGWSDESELETEVSAEDGWGSEAAPEAETTDPNIIEVDDGGWGADG